MLAELFAIVLLFSIYFFIYVELKVNKNNDVNVFYEELTKKTLSNEVMLKLPFHFDASHINSQVDKSTLTLIEKDKQNKFKTMEPDREIPKLLHPYLRHDTKASLFILKEGSEMPCYQANSSVDYIFVRKGTPEIALIHPKYKDNFDTTQHTSRKTKDYIWNNPSFKYLKCAEGTVVYVPNYWFVSIKNRSNRECVVEKISFTTVVRSLLLFVNKRFNYSN